MELIYTYSVWREDDNVYYNIFRDGELITQREVYWHDLNSFTAVFKVNAWSEKAIKKQMEKAHELAKYAISALEELEYNFKPPER